MAIPPVIVADAFLSTLVRIRSQIKEDRPAKRLERLAPDIDAGRILYHEVDFEMFVANCEQVAIVAEIEKLLADTGSSSGKQRRLVVPIKVNLEDLGSDLVAAEQFFLNSRRTNGGQKRRKPIFARQKYR